MDRRSRVGSLSDLFSMIGGNGLDAEHEAIVTKSSNDTLAKLKEMAGGNELALRYLTDMWTKIMDGIKENVDMSSPVLPQLLRTIADTMEERDRQHKELHDKRQAEELRTQGMH